MAKDRIPAAAGGAVNSQPMRLREWRMRRQALQIAAQLPENEDEAKQILKYVGELVSYCLGRGVPRAGESGTVARLRPPE